MLAGAALVCASSVAALIVLKVNPRWLRHLGWLSDDRARLDDRPVEVLSPDERRARLRLVLSDTGPISAGGVR